MTHPAHRRIVLVDDDDSLRRALARTIRLAGYAVETFRTADELAQSEALRTSACLVLDISLPGTSGPDFCRTLVAAGRTLPVIFITALDRDDAERAVAPLAPVKLLYKPFSNEELLAAICDACRELLLDAPRVGSASAP